VVDTLAGEPEPLGAGVGLVPGAAVVLELWVTRVASSVPHLLKISVVHASCFSLFPMLAAMQSVKACWQMCAGILWE
jgi:hypothetical protein